MVNEPHRHEPPPREPTAPPVRPEVRPYGSEPPGPALDPNGLWPTGAEVAAAVEDGVYVASPDGRILVANDALVRMLSAESVESLIGVELKQLPVDDHHRQFPLLTGPLWIRSSLGRELLVQHSRIDHAAGPRGYCAGLLRRAGTDRLAAVGVGVTGILHDLRNVLTGILGNVDEVAFTFDERRRRAAIERLQDLAAFGNAIAEQLVTYAAPSAAPRRSCDLNSAVEETVSSLRGRVPTSVRIELLLTPDLPSVWVEPTQVRQLVMNLLLNAVDALRGNEGTISIRSDHEVAAPRLPLVERIERRPRGSYGIIEVRDTGRGMTDTAMQRVFKPFVTTTGGSGLGLAVVREILMRSGGGIEIESAVGEGSAFRVYLPVKA